MTTRRLRRERRLIYRAISAHITKIYLPDIRSSRTERPAIRFSSLRSPTLSWVAFEVIEHLIFIIRQTRGYPPIWVLPPSLQYWPAPRRPCQPTEQGRRPQDPYAIQMRAIKWKLRTRPYEFGRRNFTRVVPPKGWLQHSRGRANRLDRQRKAIQYRRCRIIEFLPTTILV